MKALFYSLFVIELSGSNLARRIAMMTGEKTRLRALEKEDLTNIWKWVNDEEVMRFMSNPGNTQSLTETEQWFAKQQQATHRDGLNGIESHSKQFIIETVEGVPIGSIFYSGLTLKHQHAEIGILIGEKEYWGRGYGTDAMITLLDHLFNELGLHRVHLGLESSNTRALKCYEKCGFIQEGVIRHQFFVNGKYYDGLTMGILRDEFNSRGVKNKSG